MILRNYLKYFVTSFFPDRFSHLKGLLKKRGILVSISQNLTGPYQSWNEALNASTGYQADLILERTKNALLKVKNGESVYERDSVLFDEIQYSWPLLAGLMWVAAQSGGRLDVLDFGGSLGSTYYQNRLFLQDLSEVRWNIIEQNEYVKVGKELFSDGAIKFYTNIEDLLKEITPNVIVFGSVLQYLEKPYDTFNEIIDISSNYIIFDRTPIWNGIEDALCVQHVPSNIYHASYPHWIFSKNILFDFIKKKGYTIIAEFQNDDKLSSSVEFWYQGMILSRIKRE